MINYTFIKQGPIAKGDSAIVEIEAMSLKKALLSFGTKAGKTNEDMRKENKWKLNE